MSTAVQGLMFDGPAFDPARDAKRLTNQNARVFALMRDGEWRTLRDIAEGLGYPESSVSAQLRHMRKARFGAHTVERRYVRDGLYEYRLLVNRDAAVLVGRRA